MKEKEPEVKIFRIKGKYGVITSDHFKKKKKKD